MTRQEQRAQKAFGLRDSRDLLEKLRWELSNLFQRQRYDIAVCQYHAFNCAVTAWHMTDWLWHDINSSPTLKSKLQQKITPMNRCDEFQSYVRADCSALRLCYQIATGSKHCFMERNPDSTVEAKITEGDNYGNPIVIEGDTTHMAENLFWEALFWFKAFIREWDIFPEEPFIPQGDTPDDEIGPCPILVVTRVHR